MRRTGYYADQYKNEFVDSKTLNSGFTRSYESKIRMNWQHIETHVDFHDLESNFGFRTVNADLEVNFRDWQDRNVRFQFRNVSHFQCSPLCPLPPGEGIYTIEDSPLVDKLRECFVIGRSEPAKHYILATTSSEVECCEIVAESHLVSIDDADG